MIIAGTGSRSLALEPDDVRQRVLAETTALLAEPAPTLVLSGGAEGWDACLAAAARAAGIPYELVLPNTGYIDYYWGRKSVTGLDRRAAASRMLSGAATVTYVTSGLYATDAHTGRQVHANFYRNCVMLSRAQLGLVYGPTSPGTKHGVAELKRHEVPFRVWSTADGWSDPLA